MAKLIDFHCRYAEFTGISKETAETSGLSIPQAYMRADDIAKLAIALGVNVLPFDPVLEAENLGAKVKYDDSNLGPRKAEDLVSSIDDLSSLDPMDVSAGRLSETINALKILKSSGINATVELHGPITILNGLGDLMKMLMGWRKKPELMSKYFDLISKGLVDYALAARNAGVKIIYYADSPGSLDIIGPKYAKQVVEQFTVPFLKALDEALDKDCLIHLCPKTSFMVAGCEKATWKKLSLEEPMAYHDACISASGKVRFLGQRCRKDNNLTVQTLNYLELTE